MNPKSTVNQQLLLTRATDETLRMVPVSWDMDKPYDLPSLLHEGYRLDFPTDLKPGHYWCARATTNETIDPVHNVCSVGHGNGRTTSRMWIPRVAPHP